MLVTTSPEPGGFLFEPPALEGHNDISDGGPEPFPSAFYLSFDLTIGTGFACDGPGWLACEGPLAERKGGEGISISVGELPNTPAGEYGMGDGLRVSLRTRANVLTIEYADRLLHTGPLPNSEGLRSNVPFPVDLILRNDSLSLHLNSTAVLVDAPLPEWRTDSKPSWRFGFGARTNHIRGENHFVHNLALDLGPGLDPESVGVSVTCNGQQYAPQAADVRLGYFGAPVPLVVEPRLGPAHGGTSVIVRGEQLHGGSAYRCRFGTRVVHATFNATDRTIRCVTPPLRPPF